MKELNLMSSLKVGMCCNNSGFSFFVGKQFLIRLTTSLIFKDFFLGSELHTNQKTENDCFHYCCAV